LSDLEKEKGGRAENHKSENSPKNQSSLLLLSSSSSPFPRESPQQPATAAKSNLDNQTRFLKFLSRFISSLFSKVSVFSRLVSSSLPSFNPISIMMFVITVSLASSRLLLTISNKGFYFLGRKEIGKSSMVYSFV